MPSPRPPGLGVEKILVSSHKIPKDHVFYFVVFACRPSEPGVGLFTGSLRFFFFPRRSSPSLSLAALRAPLLLPAGCSAIPGEVSHFITVIALYLGDVSMPFPLDAVVSVPRREGRLLILLVSRRRFVISQCKSSLRP